MSRKNKNKRRQQVDSTPVHRPRIDWHFPQKEDHLAERRELGFYRQDIEMPWELVDAMMRHMIQGRPNEVCGLIAADDHETPAGYWPITSDKPSPSSYHMDPVEHAQAMLDLRGCGMHVWGIFHSHPFGWAHPSGIDTGQAAWPELHYLIGTMRGPHIRAFRFLGENREVQEDEITCRYQTVNEQMDAVQEREAKHLTEDDVDLEDIGITRAQLRVELTKPLAGAYERRIHEVPLSEDEGAWFSSL